MKESVAIAHTFAGRFAAAGAPCPSAEGTTHVHLTPSEANKAFQFLRQAEIHLHVPQGATPKVTL